MINIDINFFKMKMSNCLVLKIINDLQEKYLVEWGNHKKEWLDKEDISSYALKIYDEIKLYNSNICQNMLLPKTSFVYCRATRDGEIDKQKKICVDYCQKNNLPIEYLIEDKVSSRKMKNLNYELGSFTPYLDENNIIIVQNSEVLSKDLIRGISFLEGMMKRNIEIHFIENNIIWNNNTTEEDKRKLWLSFIDAEYKSNLASKKKINELKSIPPFGFKSTSSFKFKSCNLEQKIIQGILNLYKQKISIGIPKKEINKLILTELNKVKINKSRLPKTTSSISRLVNKYLKIEEESMKLLTSTMNSCNV